MKSEHVTSADAKSHAAEFGVGKMDIDDKNKKNLITCYKAFFEKASEINKDNDLTDEEMNAVAQNVLDGLLDKAFVRAKIPQEERNELKSEIEKLLRKECPELIFKSGLRFEPEQGFSKKSN